MRRSQYVYIWWGCVGNPYDMLGVWTVKHEAMDAHVLLRLGGNASLIRYPDGLRKSAAVTIATLRDGVLTEWPDRHLRAAREVAR